MASEDLTDTRGIIVIMPEVSTDGISLVGGRSDTLQGTQRVTGEVERASRSTLLDPRIVRNHGR